MKFSRNPATGLLECYTDDGVFLGNMVTMGDDIMDKSDKKEKKIDKHFMTQTLGKKES